MRSPENQSFPRYLADDLEASIGFERNSAYAQRMTRGLGGTSDWQPQSLGMGGGSYVSLTKGKRTTRVKTGLEGAIHAPFFSAYSSHRRSSRLIGVLWKRR